MRDIKFRGKRTDTGEWVYGGLDTDWGLQSSKRERYWIIAPYYGQIFVDPATVGEYTGLKDKAGVEIYEGDVVRCSGEYYVVQYEMGDCLCENTNDTDDRRRLRFLLNTLSFEVVGNITDNPELAKEA